MEHLAGVVARAVAGRGKVKEQILLFAFCFLLSAFRYLTSLNFDL